MSAAHGAASASPASFDVVNPRDGSVLETLPMTPAAELPGLVAAAREASRAWATLSMKERVRRLRRIKDAFVNAGPELAKLLMAEGGKSEVEALTSEIVPSCDLFDYWTKAAPKFLAREPVSINPVNFPGKRGYIDYEPRGVIALITPWNYPCSIPLRALVPGLLAGNAFVWKPSEQSPLIARALHQIFAAELPPNLITVVSGDARTGDALLDADIDAVSFTGSSAVGRQIAAKCSPRLIPVSLELGGKNAAIVLEDADLERASAGISWAAYANAGQNCAAMSRVYVVKSVAAEFERQLRARTAAIRTGADGRELFDVGPVSAQRHLDRVARHVDEAKAAGTEVLAGGEREGTKGFFFQPTLLRAPAEGLAVSREETFGPVLSLHVVEDESEAVRRANEGEYGLHASLWTRDLARGERLAKALEVGAVSVNNTSFLPVLPNAPWAGRKASGMGATNSHRALSEMVKTRFVLVDRTVGGEPWWFPHDAGFTALGRAFLGMMSSSIGRKLQAIAVILPGLGRRKAQLKAPVR
jgi:acyl-CoA reductase-like NAD-dependent aldehyde dehydrogenase